MRKKRGVFDEAIECLKRSAYVLNVNYDAAILLLQAARKIKWKSDDPKTSLLQRFDEITEEPKRRAKLFFGDWIWKERIRAIDIARALIEAIPDNDLDDREKP